MKFGKAFQENKRFTNLLDPNLSRTKMKASSSSSAKSEAQSPFVRAPVEQINVDRRLKCKLDFEPDPYLYAPLMEIGCSIPGPSNKRFCRQLKDESITQPVDDQTKPNEGVDLVPMTDEVKDSCGDPNDAYNLFFPRNLYPPLDMLRCQPTPNVFRASSHIPEEPCLVNMTIMNRALQVRVQQLEAELESLKRFVESNPSFQVKSAEDKNLPPTDSVAELAFEDWYSSPDPLKKNMRIPVPTMEVQGVTREWFRSILDRHELISDQHIDSILHLFITERKRHGVWWEKWSLMDMVCWQALTQLNYECVRELVMPYVLGECPAGVGGVWGSFEAVYGVGHVSSNHWLLYEVNFLAQRITIYDPKSFLLKFDDYIPVFEFMSCHIPKLLRDAKIVFHADGKVLPHCPSWEIARFYNTPQQKSKEDCTIMALEYLACLTNKQDVNTVDPNACDARRLSYCCALYKFGINLLRDVRGLNP